MLKNKSRRILCISFLLIFFVAIGQNNKSFDMGAYLKEADAETIYPSARQIEMLNKAIPEQTFQPAPNSNDRVYWNTIAATKTGKEYLDESIALIDKKPEVPITDEIYRKANLEGNRGIYKPRYYRSMENLEHFVLAECIENKGRFIPQINNYLQAIMAMKSWLHPNHDDKNNGVLEGKRVSIDLGARKFGGVLALANVLLDQKLSPDIKKKISAQLQWRITDNYLKSSKEPDENNLWLKSTSNWNSVCSSGAVLTTIINSTKREERIATIGSALNSMKYYLSGFGADGYCTEGLGYWGYGFGHYLYLAQILSDYTEGKINLFEADNADKLKNIGNFPERFEIQNTRCAPFADGVSTISKSGSNFADVLSAKHYDAIMPSEIRMEEAAEQLIAWQQPEVFTPNKNKTKNILPDHAYFDDLGMVISRGKQKTPFSIAIKAGHNAENHNHSDVGTYTLVLGNDIMSGDIGAPSYTAGSFSPDNKARSSWGHPVPLINNTLQSNGIQFKGIITATDFEEKIDKVTMDIKPAYEIPVLQSLERIMTNDKSGSGTITVEDHFTASKPVSFGTAIMTYSKYEIVDNHTVILITKNQKLKAEVTSKGGSLKITDEQVPVKALREGGTAYRIGVNFINAVKEGTITIKYTPIN
ncbi:heparinase II/III family protein [Flavobacterium algicola]|uniref:heparinase II/III family protein n=1 Tax=Flavobacterium algicola TaxID=556529 RepID=UPI001EFD890F|nr:heparinase II/III family protein [Flavobacterium algicola]MCG9792849.1 heparinase II/III family protein [Flavobacterium algicola]